MTSVIRQNLSLLFLLLLSSNRPSLAFWISSPRPSVVWKTQPNQCQLGQSKLYRHDHEQERRQLKSISTKPYTPLYAQRQSLEPKEKKKKKVEVGDDEDDLVDDEKPAGIVGAEFFGGNKQKEEFYDEMEERNVLLTMPTTIARTNIPSTMTTTGSTTTTTTETRTDITTPVVAYSRFENRVAFSSDRVAQVASSLQAQINAILYGEDLNEKEQPIVQYPTKGSQVDWVSPFTKGGSSTTATTTSPLDELRSAMKFYKHLDLAIVSGREVSGNQSESQTSTIELQWEISVAWPTFWEPRVLLLGSSILTIGTSRRSSSNNVSQQGTTSDTSKLTTGTVPSSTILRQVDTILTETSKSMTDQLIPRFWDLYHIGMTPSAELSPTIPQRGGGRGGSNYQVITIPARWMVQPTMFETGTRQDGNAQIIPNHAFSSFISTMGPTRQRYVPTIGTSVRIRSDIPRIRKEDNDDVDSSSKDRDVPPTSQSTTSSSSGSTLLEWQIPLSVEFQSQLSWLVAPSNEEATPNSDPQCNYVFQPQRMVATVAYGGEAQDVEIGQIRKQLYERVLKDGIYRPKLDDNGRPIFSFLYGTTKACYTRQGGLGMCVYEWRPTWAKSNHIGLELVQPGGTDPLLPLPSSTK